MKKVLLFSLSLVPFLALAEEVVKKDENKKVVETKKSEPKKDDKIATFVKKVSIDSINEPPMVDGLKAVTKGLKLTISEDEALKKIQEKMGSKENIDEIVKLYKNALGDDLEAIIKFSESPAGKTWFKMIREIGIEVSYLLMKSLQEGIADLNKKYGKKKKEVSEIKTVKKTDKPEVKADSKKDKDKK